MSLALPGFGQHVDYQLTARLLDSAGRHPVVYATVNLYDAKKNVIASSYSDERGWVKMDKLLHRPVRIEITAGSYRPVDKELTWAAGSVLLDLGMVEMAILPEDLQHVLVSGRRRLVEQKPGMLVYRAGNDPANQGGTAADVLRKAPILSVDAQGNVSMRGSSSLRILINGKFSGQMARSPADALNMIPANIIESVEIVTNPSAKYDAEGTAGVINIITRKGTNKTTGAVEVSGSNLNQVINPRIEYTSGKWNVSVHGHLHRRRSKNQADYNRTFLSDNSILYQEWRGDNAAPHASADFTVVYDADSLTEWSLGVNTSAGKWPSDNTIRNNTFEANGDLRESYMQYTTASDRYFNTDINLSYKKKLQRPGQELVIQAQWSPGKTRAPYQTTLLDDTKLAYYRENNSNRIRNNEWTLQADYVYPLSNRYTLETGVKGIWRKAGNSYTVTANTGSGWMEVSDRTDFFGNDQQVAAGYGLLKATINSWYLEAGLRYEHTFMSGALKQAAQQFDQQFGNLVPTATITRKLNADQNLSLSYTKRITRPYIIDMNPNINASDPKNLSSGNPGLRPEIAHQVELVHGLNAGSSFFLNSALFWRKTDNSIIEYSSTDAAGIVLTRKENLAGNTSYGINLSATAMPAQWLTINGGLSPYHIQYESAALAVKNNGWVADMNLSTAVRFPKHYSAQVNFNYNGRQINLQGDGSSTIYYSAAVKKEWNKPKLSLTLLAVNPFNEYTAQDVWVRTAGFRSFSLDRYYLREWKLTLNWEFGAMNSGRRAQKISNDDIRSDDRR
ncbi:MAG: TonB-dependent receptor [Flavihumibacter sp.]